MKELITFSGRRASQNHFELTSLINLLKKMGVKNYLEVGARHGDTFHEIMINLPSGSKGIALDLPGGLWGRRDTSVSLVKAVEDLVNRKYNVSYILGDSTAERIVEKLQKSAPFDAIFIDGDHTLEGVTKDWKIYKNMSNIIIFHDIVGTGQKEKRFNKKVEVPILWEEIKSKYPKTIEFVDEGSLMGIGIVFLQ